MITEAELIELLDSTESFRVEKTVATNDFEKFREAICSFANDMPRSGKPGFLLIGYDDKKRESSGLVVSDQLLQDLSSLARDGRILPQPALVAYKMPYPYGPGDIAVVEVQPSPSPPVRYNQRICVRTGPRRGFANEAEESILNERRQAAHLHFDSQPCLGSSLRDLSLDLFTTTYRTQAIDPEVVAENHRPLEHQMASLRLFDLRANCPTHAGVLLFAKDPLIWLPNAFVQYIRFDGLGQGGDVLADRRFSGDLLNMLREMDQWIKGLPVEKPAADSPLHETSRPDYPMVALRELVMNSIMHRSYEAASFTRILRFDDRIEIISPGPLYGEATARNFPRQTSYRNPVVAEAMKILGFVNRYGRGVERAQSALAANGNPPAAFEFGDTFFCATLRGRA